MKRLAILAIASIATRAHADPPTADPKAVFQSAIEAHIQTLNEHFDKANKTLKAEHARAKVSIADVRASARAAPLDEDNTAAVVQKASLAIKTDVEDVVAGVAVAPLVLIGRTSTAARSWSVVAASLDDDKFRIGTSYRFEIGALGLDPEALAIRRCSFDEKAYRATLAAAADDYGSICAAFASIDYPADGTNKDRQAWVTRAALCGAAFPPEAEPELQDVYRANRAGNLIAKVTGVLRAADALKAVAGRSPAGAELARVATNSVPKLEALQISMPSITSCIDDAKLPSSVVQARWAATNLEIGLSTHADFFPRKFGFNPDESKRLPSGEVAEADFRAELRLSHARWTLTGGIGGKLAREAFDDEDFTRSIRPSIGIELVAFRLDGGRVTGADRKVALTKNDELPPYLVFGLDAAMGLAFDRPASQRSLIDEVAVSLFADVKISDSIAFRLGVPLKAEIVTREKDDMAMPMVTERKALQWTVPVFVTTVLKM